MSPVAGRRQRDRFCVRLPLPLVPPLADHLVPGHDDRADDRVRMRRPAAALGEPSARSRWVVLMA
jgi:hypothetical protein